MNLMTLSIQDRLKENAYIISQNFNQKETLTYNNSQLKEALFHINQTQAFENLELNLKIMFDFLYGKNRVYNQKKHELYQYVQVVSNIYLLHYMIYEVQKKPTCFTFALGQLKDQDFNFEGTLSVIAINIEDQVIDSFEYIKKYHSNPNILAKELNDALLQFKDFINPTIESNILMNSKPIDVKHINNSTWRKHPFIHYLVFGGCYRDTFIQCSLNNLIDELS